MTQNIGEICGENSQMVDYMLPTHQQQEPFDHVSSSFCSSTSLDKFNFQDVMQFPDFPPKNITNPPDHQAELEQTGINIDPNIYFLKFPVLNDHGHEHEHDLMFDSTSTGDIRGGGGHADDQAENDSAGQLRFINGENLDQKCPLSSNHEVKNKKKRARSIKTSEEVESQRMTHIAVERNRRKQMNEHLRVLRSLMPGSYVQRGDQASIIGGAIEFVRELEQLLQCLESQKRRRLYGDAGGTNPNTQLVDQEAAAAAHQPPFFPVLPPPNDDQMETGMGREDIAESKSCIADVEVKLLGFDAMIKILSRRREGQLVKTIAALEDLQLNILHINITTIDQTVLYSLTVKVGGEARLTAEDIANSVQQIFTFIHAYNNI